MFIVLLPSFISDQNTYRIRLVLISLSWRIHFWYVPVENNRDPKDDDVVVLARGYINHFNTYIVTLPPSLGMCIPKCLVFYWNFLVCGSSFALILGIDNAMIY